MPGSCSEGWDHFLLLATKAAQFHSSSKSKHRCIWQSFRMHLQLSNTAPERMAVIGTLSNLSRDCWGPLLVWYIINCPETLRPHHPTPLITGELTQCVTRRGVDKAFLWQQHYTIGHCFQTEKITRGAISLHTSHPFPRWLGINRLTHVVLHTDYFDSTLWKYERHCLKHLLSLT